MSQAGTIEYLVIVAGTELPPESVMVRALASAGLGTFDYTPTDIHSGPLPTGAAGRTRLGAYTSVPTSVTHQTRIIAYRHDKAVTNGMGESAFARITRDLPEASAETVRAGSLALSVRVTIPDDLPLAALDWSLALLQTVLRVSDGVAIDPIAQRCYDSDSLVGIQDNDPLAHLAIHNEPHRVETRWLHTHGLEKFHRPELEMLDVPFSLEEEALSFLREVSIRIAHGARLAPGDEIDMEELGRLVTVALAPDADHAAAFGRLCIVDAPLLGQREDSGAIRFLKASVLQQATQYLMRGDYQQASESIERVLSADADDGAALALNARVLLATGDPVEALSIGEFLALRAPGDYRGPFIRGLALAELGRFREALTEFNHAITLHPEVAEAFSARAAALERLGQHEQAAEDRIHAEYLGQ